MAESVAVQTNDWDEIQWHMVSAKVGTFTKLLFHEP